MNVNVNPASPPRRRGNRRSVAGLFRAAADLALAEADNISWPSTQYAADPVGFARDILGVEPWTRQVDVLEALIPPRARVAVAAGQKVSKSHTAVIAALWFYCSFEDARVVLTSTTSRQVDTILWRELRMLFARAKRPIDGEPSLLARSGLKSQDFREVYGFTAREPEAVQGISGRNVFHIVDEASGVPDEIFEAIEGNRAGGARILLIGNPTKTEGEFFDAFHSKERFYSTHRISSEESPNVVEGREVIPGLAEREFIEQKRQEWGEDSPLYKVRIKGEFVLSEDGKLIPVHLIAEAEGRYDETPADGRLYLGVDPAGPGQGGDETVFAARRGQKILKLHPFRGLTEEAHLVRVLDVLKEHRHNRVKTGQVPREQAPIVTVDREGPIGGGVYAHLKAYSEQHPGIFEVAAVRASDRALREPHLYDRVRDELWANLSTWLKEGGAIPEDTRLAKELHAPEWRHHHNGRLKVTPKVELRKMLEGSPDRADAVALAVWEPAIAKPANPPPPRHEPPRYGQASSAGMDPYAGALRRPRR